MAMSELDLSLLNKAVIEVNKLKSKYGLIDNAVKTIATKVESSNEGIGSSIIIGLFSLHAILKLLVALKNGWSVGKYLKRIFYSGGYSELTTLRDIAISITFIIYLIAYIVNSNGWIVDLYEYQTGAVVNLEYQWDGIHNYKVRDTKGKIYYYTRTGIYKYDIMYNGKLIGKYNNGNIISLDGVKILDDINVKGSFNTVDGFDLEKLLLKKYKHLSEIDKTKEEINKREEEIGKLHNQIDSLKNKTFENVDQTRKLLKDIDIDYDKLNSYTIDNEIGRQLGMTPDKFNVIKGVNELKSLMIKDNTLGYLGTFTNFLIKNASRSNTNDYLKDTSYESTINLYKELIQNKDLIDKLRDSSGKLTPVIEFKKREDLDDAIHRAKDWQKVNTFIRKLPPTQKKLIWKDGWFSPELSNLSQYLTTAILSIASNKDREATFLKKISSIKDRNSLIELISSASNNEVWDYKYWLHKLNSQSNVIVTWKSEEKKQIVCTVFTHSALKKIAYMTNWCIFRDSDYFNQYSSKGSQYILYDFSKSEKDNDCIIGFTLDTKFSVYACHNKQDYSARLPYDFYIPTRDYTRYVKPEYIKFTMRDAMKKLDMSILKLVSMKIRNFLSRGKLGKFIDFYDVN